MNMSFCLAVRVRAVESGQYPVAALVGDADEDVDVGMGFEHRLRRADRLGREHAFCLRHELGPRRDLLQRCEAALGALAARELDVMGEHGHLRLAAQGLIHPMSGIGPHELGSLQVVKDDPSVGVRQGIVGVVEHLDALGMRFGDERLDGAVV